MAISTAMEAFTKEAEHYVQTIAITLGPHTGGEPAACLRVI